VESYDEETYQCASNDSFRSISLAYYHTDKYEKALQLFNRNHPLAADPLKQDAVALQAGLSVYIPPKRILDKYYVNSSATSTQGLGLQERSVSIQATQPPPVAATVSERTYRVKNTGEMFREIARNTLGDPERWAEIYRLNPKFDPAEPIPSGTDLRIPSQARVDARPSP
jgi:nucleoid-associated protein YgaU